ncbi:MAG: CTP synthase [Armatimonadetes bacterium]|nr:CTP synthase [Armatimonadota bacterium]
MQKYIFVTGGVVSSIGKGIFCASLGRLLKSRGIKVTVQKMDPYINVDAGTMNPYQHGEVFVTEDGAETDLDLGHYERFIDVNLKKESNLTTGKIYGAVISRERKGDYLGDTVRVIPHITNQIKEDIRKVAVESDVTIVEVGGTVGDIESLPFLEAIRQFKNDVGAENVLYIHLTLIPFLSGAAELKTKPTQHSVKELRNIGIQPDVIICRTEKVLTEEMIDKIALHCDVDKKAVFQSLDVQNIYEIPLLLEAQGLGNFVNYRLRLSMTPPDLRSWEQMIQQIRDPRDTVTIALAGKYVGLKDAYISISEALRHGGIGNGVHVRIKRVDAELLEGGGAEEHLADVHGILVPGGFGARGLEGKVSAVKYAREKNIPYLGICYGLQCAVVEFARNVCAMEGANSTECDSMTRFPIIDLLPEQVGVQDMGATMRLGSYPCTLVSGSLSHKAYGEEVIQERHRHRYEVNNHFRSQLVERGMLMSGIFREKDLVEIIEIPGHRWFIASQFHPEFKSRPNRPHPLFRDFIKAGYEYKMEKESGEAHGVSAATPGSSPLKGEVRRG